MSQYKKFLKLPHIQGFKLLLAFAIFVVFIAVPMSLTYSTDTPGNASYTENLENEYSDFLGLDIFGLVSLIILGLTTGEIDKAILFMGAFGLLIYVMVLTDKGKNTSDDILTEERAKQAKFGFFTDGVIVGLSGYVLAECLRKHFVM